MGNFISEYRHLGGQQPDGFSKKCDGIDTQWAQNCDASDTHRLHFLRRDRHLPFSDILKLSTGDSGRGLRHFGVLHVADDGLVKLPLAFDDCSI